jgi:hypothetical protein
VITRAGRDYIRDFIDSTDLMKVNLFDGHVMNFGFARAKKLEGPDGGLLHRRSKIRTMNQRTDRAQRTTVSVFVRMVGTVAVSPAGFVLVLSLGLLRVRGALLMAMVVVLSG